ncbi:ABC transporter substrate-binding protein [Chelativorans alearense]|uniref:ABC transporter substrate-binding protein n=1 Tax=Chelativorans alearense TaxID=2681495 RepID=UPI0013D7C731|nr:ABC transporter substrate-binding protein [Chelativorans alearense]
MQPVNYSRRTVLIGAAALAGILSFAAISGSANAQDEDTLRVVMQADVRIVDPIWTTSYIVRDHGYMIYDTLFAMDANGEIQPQMVDRYTVSEDKLTYTFTLRGGLLWHDNQPVTTADIIPSIKRWAARDALGQTVMTFVTSIEAKDDLTFEIKLKEPTGLLIFALGKPSSNVPFMMPKRIAETDPNTQISEFIGSGPFVFMSDEWRPGDKAVYTKFEGYKPRSEAPSGLTGGKVAKVSRVEWRVIADQQQAVNALLNGEIDIIQQPGADLFPLLKDDPSIKIVDWNPYGYQFNLRFNQAVKPFDNPKIRQAALYALNQEDFLQAAIGNPEYYTVCKAMFVCGTQLETIAGMEDKLESNFAKSKQLLADAGYDGEPVVLLHSTDLPALTNIAPVAKSLLERGGFVVDMQSMDWQTVLSRRVRKEPPSQGGWNAMATYWSSADVLNPVMGAFFNASGDKAAFGWPNDPEMEELRRRFVRADALEEQKGIAEAVQLREAESPTHIVLGQFNLPGATRSNVSGWIPAAAPVFWNIEKGNGGE